MRGGGTRAGATDAWKFSQNVSHEFASKMQNALAFSIPFQLIHKISSGR
jgi:hypothetical protein